MNAHQRRVKARSKLKYDWKALRKQLKGKIVNRVIKAEMPTIPTGRGFIFNDLDWTPSDSEQMKSRLNRTHGNVLDGENLIRESVDSKVDALPLHDHQLQAMENLKKMMPERGPVFVLGEAPGLSALMSHRMNVHPELFLITPNRERDLDASVTMTVLKARDSKFSQQPFEINFDFATMKFDEPEKKNDDN